MKEQATVDEINITKVEFANSVSIKVSPKEGVLADLFDEAEGLNLKGEDFGNYIKKRLDEIGLNISIVTPPAI
jgi:hypothetical protein